MASLIKLTMGYSSGGLGGTEVAVIRSVTVNDAVFFITNSDNFDFDRDSDHAFN